MSSSGVEGDGGGPWADEEVRAGGDVVEEVLADGASSCCACKV